jgi:plasmid maintenance system antidote protein VapI
MREMTLLDGTPKEAGTTSALAACPEACVAQAPRLEEFQDYRTWLRALYLWRKQVNPKYSYRLLAAKLGMDVSFVHRILNGRSHLSRGLAPRIAALLGLDGDLAKRFVGMVHGAKVLGSSDEPGADHAPLTGFIGYGFEPSRPDHPRLEDYEDYRTWLLDHYQWCKQGDPGYSYRLLASRLGMDVSQVHRILNRRIHLSQGMAPKIAALLDLQGDVAERFVKQVADLRSVAYRRASVWSSTAAA